MAVTKRVIGKTKVVKLRNCESIMDGNTIQTPFIAPYSLKDRTTGESKIITSIKYEWESIENGERITRGIKVSGHGELGVPTLKDKKVLRALQDIYIRSKVKDGVLKLETDPNKIKEKDLMIEFNSIENIATAMGQKFNGQKSKAIKESIERLVATTIFNTHNGGLYDAVNKRYITDSNISFRYLESMSDYTVYDCDNCLYVNGCRKDFDNCISPNKKTDVTKIKMSLFTYLNIANNYRLYYNRDNTNEIKNLIAEDVYLISRKWLGKGYISRANIKKYIDRIPMETKKLYHKKQAIKKAVTLLNEYDFVEAYVENDIVVVKHLDKIPRSNKKSTDDLPIIGDTSYYKDRFVTFVDFKKGFDDIGFTEDEINDVLGDMQRIEYLKALLRYVYLTKQYNSDINPKEYFMNCFNKNIVIDKKYYSSIE